MLTNGVDYRLYHLTWEKAGVDNNLILSFNLLDDDINDVRKKLSLLTKESFKKGIIDKFIAETTSLDDKNLLQAMLSKRTLSAIWLALKDITGHNIKEEAIEGCIKQLFNDEVYELAKSCVKKTAKKPRKQTSVAVQEEVISVVAGPEGRGEELTAALDIITNNFMKKLAMPQGK